MLAPETREWRALADGLHDGPIQSLLAARHDLEDVAGREPGDSALERADEALLDVVRQLRSAIFELHPHVLEEAGLDGADRQVAETAARRSGFRLTLELEPLPPRGDTDRLLFSVARELITNVSKHAEARVVTVTLHDDGGVRTPEDRDRVENPVDDKVGDRELDRCGEERAVIAPSATIAASKCAIASGWRERQSAVASASKTAARSAAAGGSDSARCR